MKKEPPITNSTASVRALEQRQRVDEYEREYRKPKPDMNRIGQMSRALDSLYRQDEVDRAASVARGAGSRPSDDRTRTFDKIAENSSGSMRKTVEPRGRMNKRKDDLYKPD